jgi:hypothetical protein
MDYLKTSVTPFVSSCSYDKLLPISWLKTTKMYLVTVLEVRNPK